MSMTSGHWVLIAVVFIIGYAVARFYPQLGQTVGLP